MKIDFFKIKCMLVSLLWAACTYPLSNKDLFEGKNILILGGTGYIGRALTSEILKYNPHAIIIFSRDEVKHFNFINVFGKNPKIKNIIGDIRDFEALVRATRDIDIVFHAAALKRIDDLEQNVEECIKTNILGSMNVFNACIVNDVPRVLFISTDKACSPINTYGACKFISEKIFTNYDKSEVNTKFIVARYGNILESTGSVIPIFTEKIKKGEDIPLTDARMTRFILDKTEAIDLIFDAVRYGVGGEIFSKYMPSFKIIDLIEILKEKYQAQSTVKTIGMRPGEKIHEMMINESEMVRTYQYKGYYIIRPSTQNSATTELPVYVRKGAPLSMEHFSSDQAVIGKEEIATLFRNIGIL